MAFEDGPFGIPLEEGVRLAFDVAYVEAAAQAHEQLEVEHVALALLADPLVARVLERIGARTDAVEKALEQSLGTRRRIAVLEGERGISTTLDYAFRVASKRRGGADRRSLIAALVEQSPVAAQCAAAGAAPSAIRAEEMLGDGAAGGASPYRSSKEELSWTLHLASDGDLPQELLGELTRLVGLSRFGSRRALIGSRRRGGVHVGLFSESDAALHARTLDEQARNADVKLRVIAARCVPESSLAEMRQRDRTWWTTVQSLRVASSLCVAVAVGLGGRNVFSDRTISMGEALDGPDRHVTLKAQENIDNPRFLLREGLLFATDPRQPHAVGTPFDHQGLTNVRVSMTYFTLPVFTFEADRRLPSESGSRTAPAWWGMATCNNCAYDILLVRTGGPPSDLRVRPASPVEGTIRALGDAGRSAEELTAHYRSLGGRRDIAYVIDLDPLPVGPVTELVPICPESLIEDPRCVPEMWGTFDGRQLRPAKGVRRKVVEGWLGTSSDPRLRTGSRSIARVLRYERVPVAPTGQLRDAGLAALGAVLFGIGAVRVRRRGRPSEAR